MVSQTTETVSLVLKAKENVRKVVEKVGKATTKSLDLVSRGVKAARRALTRMGAVGRKALRGIGRAAKRVGGIIKKALSSSLLKLSATIGGLFIAGQAISGANEYGRAIAEVSTIVDSSVFSVERLKEEVLALAGAQGQNETEVARGLYQTISSGAVDAADSLEFLAVAQRLAIAGVSTTAQSVDVLTSALAAYNLPVSEAGRLSDILFKTVELGKTTIPELASNLGQILPTASKLGVPLEEVASAIAALTRSGLSTAEATTQLNAVFTAFLKKVETANSIFGKNQNVVNAQAFATKGLQQALVDLDFAAGGSEETIVKLTGRVEGAKAIFALTGAGTETFTEILEKNARSIGASELAYKKFTDNAQFRTTQAFTRVRQEIQKTFGVEITEAVDRAIQNIGGAEVIAARIGDIGALVGRVFSVVIENIGKAAGEFDDFVSRFGNDAEIRQAFVLFGDLLVASFGVAVDEVELKFVQLLGFIREQATSNPVTASLFGLRFREDVETELREVARAFLSTREEIDNFASDDLAGFSVLLARSEGLQVSIAQLQKELESSPSSREGFLEVHSDRVRGFEDDVASSRIELAGIISQIAALGTVADGPASAGVDRLGERLREALDAESRAADGPLKLPVLLDPMIPEQPVDIPGTIIPVGPPLEEPAGLQPSPGLSFADPGEAQSITQANNALAERIGLLQQLEPTTERLLEINALSRELTVANINALVEEGELTAQAAVGLIELAGQVEDTANKSRESLSGLALAGRQVSTALQGELTGSLIAFAEGTKSAGEAFDEFVDNVLKQIVKIAITNAVTAGFGGLGFAAGGAVISGGVKPAGGIRPSPFGVGFPKFNRGGIIDQPSFFAAGEGGKPEAIVPLVGNSIPVIEIGGGQKRGGGDTFNFEFKATDSRGIRELITDQMPVIIGGVKAAMAGGDRGLIDTTRQVSRSFG